MLVAASYDDIWLRDTGPTFLTQINAGAGRASAGRGQGRGLLEVRWAFNGWGNKHFNVKKDKTVSGQIARLADGGGAALEIQCPLVLEGGSFHTDGNGTIITTEECLLHPNHGALVGSTADPRRK